MSTRPTALTAATAAVAAIVIAGCAGSAPGTSPPSTSPPATSSPSTSSPRTSPAGTATAEPAATALITAMQASVRQATSVHVNGRLTSNGVPIGVDLDMHRNGDVSGTESLNGAPYQVVGVNGTVYVKATPAFLQEVKAPPSACSLACGKWLQLTPALASQLTGDFSMSNFTGPLTSSELSKFTETGTKTVGGQTAWVLSAGQGVTLDLSPASGHFPLAATTGGTPSEVITYSQWNEAPQPVPPPASDVLNLSNLK